VSSDFSDDDVTRLRIALARISRSVERTSADSGYTRTQLSVLGSVVRLGQPGLAELADAEGLNPTMLSRVVGKLEAAGLLTRQVTAADRRVVEVTATPAGRALHLRLRKRRADLLAGQLAELPAGQSARLQAALPALESLAAQMLRGTRRLPVAR